MVHKYENIGMLKHKKLAVLYSGKQDLCVALA